MFTSSLPLFQAAERATLSGKPAAIGAFNVNFYAQAAGILEGLRCADAPGIIQASRGANKFQGGPQYIAKLLKVAMEDSGHSLPVTLHLDHGTKEACLECIETGFSSVMIDASEFQFEENTAVTKEIVNFAHPNGVQVEGEYGKLEGVEEDVVAEKTTYADPKKVPEFFKKSDADSLATAYGTSHGPNKGKHTDKVKTAVVKESHDLLVAAGMNMNHFLVSHGSSTVPPELVAEVNKYGGQLADANGIPMEKLQEATAFGIRKINIDTDLRIGITAVFRKYFYDNPGIEESSENLKKIKEALDTDLGVIDPRGYLKVIDIELLRKNPSGTDLEEVMKLVKEKVAGHVEQLCYSFGCAGLEV